MTRKGENFELDQQNWTTYSKFKRVCNNIAIEMADSRIAVELEVPHWKDEHGPNYSENPYCRFQVTHEITHLTYFLMANEVGGNLNQKGDGHRGVALLTCERG